MSITDNAFIKAYRHGLAGLRGSLAPESRQVPQAPSAVVLGWGMSGGGAGHDPYAPIYAGVGQDAMAEPTWRVDLPPSAADRSVPTAGTEPSGAGPEQPIDHGVWRLRHDPPENLLKGSSQRKLRRRTPPPAGVNVMPAVNRATQPPAEPRAGTPPRSQESTAPHRVTEPVGNRFDACWPPSSQESTAPRAVTEPVANRFDACWEVDQFDLPATCRQLQAECAAQLMDVIRGVLRHAWQGRNILAITACHGGEGVTTVCLTLAELASSFQIRVAVVDGNFCHPDLGPALGLTVPSGWESCGVNLGLEEVAIQSRPHGLVALPLGRGGERHVDQPASLVRQLTSQFELVILDAGPMFSAAHDWFAPPAVSGVHGAIVVRDARVTGEPQLHDVLCRLEASGVKQVGVIENFLGRDGQSRGEG